MTSEIEWKCQKATANFMGIKNFMKVDPTSLEKCLSLNGVKPFLEWAQEIREG